MTDEERKRVIEAIAHWRVAAEGAEKESWLEWLNEDMRNVEILIELYLEAKGTTRLYPEGLG